MKPKSEQLAAVAYLNMLPFFADNDRIVLYQRPTDLNHDLQAGHIGAGCSSVLAGLEAGLEPLMPLKGVAAENLVESVFIEAFLGNDDDNTRWAQFRIANEDRLTGLGTAPLDTGSDEKAWTREVTLYSTGASAQSHWIVKSLFEAQGLKVTTVQLELELEQSSPDDLSRFWKSQQRSGLACLLSIGDPALERRLRYPCSAKLIRYDVAELWREATGTPCIFALWFRSPSLNHEHRVAGQQICDALERWRNRPDHSKVKTGLSFLRHTGKHALADLLGSEGVLHYLNQLNFDLDEISFQKSFNLMRALYETQTTLRAKKLVSSSRSTVNLMRFL